MTKIPHIQNDIENLLKTRAEQSQEEQVAEAQKIISEIETIDSRAAFEKVSRRIKKENKSGAVLNMMMRIAAILFVPLFLVSSWLFYKQIGPESNAKFAMQEITSPPGIRTQVMLPDGSKVWLNAESTIKFSVPFPVATRDVDLKGEAFFDVTKNPEKPFIVHSGQVNVKVLGTRFNCKAFENDKNIEIVLEEGKIALNTGLESTEKIMKPGDRAVIEKQSGEASITNQKIGKYIAWHTGKLVFDNTPMSEVAQMLEHWFGVEVIVQNPDILNYRFTTTFENESLFQVIELLGLSSPIRITYVPATIGKDNQTLTRSKILINRKTER